MLRPFESLISRNTAAIDLIRLTLCAILFTHGSYRYFEGTIPKLGEILGEIGFPYGLLLASLVNLAETGGTLLLATRIVVRPICTILILIYAVGILIFHRHAGFFVVGPGTGGWEYSALIITCLLAIIWDDRSQVRGKRN